MIIGYGAMGRKYYHTICGMAGVEIVAICDKQQTDEVSVPVYTCLDELLTNSITDFAIVATPTQFHFEIVKVLLQKTSMAILLEKPATLTYSEGLLLQQLQKYHNGRIAVGHSERHNPAIIKLRSLLSTETILNINIVRVGDMPIRIKDVSVLLDLAVHDIDLVRFITGQEIVQSTIYKSQQVHKEYADNAVVMLVVEGSIICSIRVDWLTPYNRRIVEVAVKDGYFIADLCEQTLVKYTRSRDDNGDIACCTYEVPYGRSLAMQMDNFINYFMRDKPNQMASLAEGILPIKIIEDSL